MTSPPDPIQESDGVDMMTPNDLQLMNVLRDDRRRRLNPKLETDARFGRRRPREHGAH